MELLVLLDAASTADGSRHAYAVSIREADSGRALLETAAALDPLDPSRESHPQTPHTAAYHALLEALRFIASHHEPIEQVAFQTSSHRLVNQLTGVEAVDPQTDPAVAELFDRAMMALLSLDAWSIAPAERDVLRRVTESARSALAGRDGAEKPTAARAPRFTIELLEDPGARCPARTPPHVRYAFGPDTPGSLCVHAAYAALALAFDRSGTERSEDGIAASLESAACALCGVRIRIDRAD